MSVVYIYIYVCVCALHVSRMVQVDSLLEKVKDHVDNAGLTEEGFRRLYTVNANFNPEEHHKKLETYLKINDNTKAARITVRWGLHTHFIYCVCVYSPR